MNDITIPPEALRAARLAFANALGDGEDTVEAACRAMLKAWPGMHHYAPSAEPYYGKHIILPLPQENINAEA